MNILLIGYRGTGKTSVAGRLALRLGWNWIDADVEVELAAAKAIAAIFAEDGEAAFRDQETTVLQRLMQLDRHVLALGGGVVLRPANRQMIRAAGHVVWLRASGETIHQRLTNDPVSSTQRPNLTADGGLQEIVAVLASREPLYRQCADINVDTESKDVGSVADEIISRLDVTPVDRPSA
ncbi:MAG: shikimate kinase [Planctomycetota bacterium]|nr:shikimate kinase [Planctomycetota bacterium]